MHAFYTALSSLHPASRCMLRCGVILSSFLLIVWLLLSCSLHHGTVTATLYTCRETIPLLTLMVLSLSITGAALTDTYDKTQR